MEYIIYATIVAPFDFINMIILFLVKNPSKIYSEWGWRHYKNDGYIHGEVIPYRFSLEGKFLGFFKDN